MKKMALVILVVLILAGSAQAEPKRYVVPEKDMRTIVSNLDDLLKGKTVVKPLETDRIERISPNVYWIECTAPESLGTTILLVKERLVLSNDEDRRVGYLNQRGVPYLIAVLKWYKSQQAERWTTPLRNIPLPRPSQDDAAGNPRS